MNVALGSIFQNSEKYIDRYVAQFYSLVSSTSEHTFEPLLVEGDSTDRTWERLNAILPGKVTKRDHGGTTFGQVDSVQRWLQISYACDGVMEKLGTKHDALLWVEADLIWEPATMLKLLSHVQKVPMVFPMIKRGRMFYDTWAFAKDGTYFRNEPPFHPMFTGPDGNELYSIDSGGSCWAIRGEIARTCRFRPPAHAMRGFCREVIKNGGSMWLDPRVEVVHP